MAWAAAVTCDTNVWTAQPLSSCENTVGHTESNSNVTYYFGKAPLSEKRRLRVTTRKGYSTTIAI